MNRQHGVKTNFFLVEPKQYSASSTFLVMMPLLVLVTMKVATLLLLLLIMLAATLFRAPKPIITMISNTVTHGRDNQIIQRNLYNEIYVYTLRCQITECTRLFGT